jgi:hypothetical protein
MSKGPLWAALVMLGIATSSDAAPCATTCQQGIAICMRNCHKVYRRGGDGLTQCRERCNQHVAACQAKCGG